MIDTDSESSYGEDDIDTDSNYEPSHGDSSPDEEDYYLTRGTLSNRPDKSKVAKTREHFTASVPQDNNIFSESEDSRALRTPLPITNSNPEIEVPPILTISADKILNSYVRWEVGNDKYSCKICDKVCKTKKVIKRHMRMHLNFKEFECPICGKRFARNCQLTVHKRTHSAEKPHKCPECGRGFREKTTLKQHLRVHTGERKFVCQICDRRFGSKKMQERHVFGHMNLRPFVCHYCDKTFARKCTLTEHLHTVHLPREKNHVCCFCGKAFVQNSSLTKHMAVHTRDPRFKCEVCEIPFRWVGSLRRHMKRTHGVGANTKTPTISAKKAKNTHTCYITIEEQDEEIPPIPEVNSSLQYGTAS